MIQMQYPFPIRMIKIIQIYLIRQYVKNVNYFNVFT